MSNDENVESRARCGHLMCDICGTRSCDDGCIRQFGRIAACSSCVRRCVQFSYEAACTFGGTIIDTSKPCGNGRKEASRT